MDQQWCSIFFYSVKVEILVSGQDNSSCYAISFIFTIHMLDCGSLMVEHSCNTIHNHKRVL